MIFWQRGFNTYLTAALFLVAFCGCQSAEGKRRHSQATFRVHIETNLDPSGRAKSASVYRQAPVLIPIDQTPFLSEMQVKEARVKEVVGGFAIEVQLDQRGTWLLEQYTTSNLGKRMAIFCQFMSPTKDNVGEGRWLAAPRIAHRITDGVLLFTPDATLEEAHQIVVGLNNSAKKLQVDF